MPVGINRFLDFVQIDYWSFLRASLAEVAICSYEVEARKVAGTVVNALSHTFMSSPRTLWVWLFYTLKTGLKVDIKSNGTTEFRKIPKGAFRRCLQQWKDRWSECVRKGPTL
jgi:hypothetical protein